MNFIKRIFGGLNTSYLIRAYLISLYWFAPLMIMEIYFALNSERGVNFPFVAFATVSTLLFPFAKLVWDELSELLLGNNIFIMDAFFSILLKLFISAILWVFAIFIAPFGILYLWHRTREPRQH